jgi:hypothetical protein
LAVQLTQTSGGTINLSSATLDLVRLAASTT